MNLFKFCPHCGSIRVPLKHVHAWKNDQRRLHFESREPAWCRCEHNKEYQELMAALKADDQPAAMEKFNPELDPDYCVSDDIKAEKEKRLVDGG